MFGSDDDQKSTNTSGPTAAAMPAAMPVNPISGDATLAQPQVSSELPKIVPGIGDTDDSGASAPKKTLLTSLPQVNRPAPAQPTATPISLPTPSSSTDDDPELATVKRKALQDLTPLVDKLDLPPEEKFKTMMMVIQAGDNPQLVEKAYEAASKISDETARAQALLDIVNEVNYFTQPHN